MLAVQKYAYDFLNKCMCVSLLSDIKYYKNKQSNVTINLCIAISK